MIRNYCTICTTQHSFTVLETRCILHGREKFQKEVTGEILIDNELEK